MPKKPHAKPKVEIVSSVNDTGQEALKPKQLELVKQRDEVEELIIKGYSVSQVAGALGVDPRTVARRIAERRTENLQKFKDTKKYTRDEKAAIYEAKYALIERKRWGLHASTDSDRTKVAAVHEVMEADEKLTKRMQMLGYLPKDGSMFDDMRPMTVIFGTMRRPDRTKQLAEQAKNEAKLIKELEQ